MKCMKCGSEMGEPVQATAEYPADIPVLVSGVDVIRCRNPDCDEKEIVIPAIEKLHRALVEAVACKPHPLSAGEIRFLRKSLGWSGKDFAARFDTTQVTVSRWENGHSAMNRQAEILLRLLATVLPPISEYGCSGPIEQKEEMRRIRQALHRAIHLAPRSHERKGARQLNPIREDDSWRIPELEEGPCMA